MLTQNSLAQCLTDLCNSLAFVNSQPNAYMGYTAWSAGGFSATDYNLTMTPKGSPGNFTDQQTVSQCVVGTRNGFNSTRTGDSSPSSSTGSFGGSAGSITTAATGGSTKLAASGVVGTLMAMIALVSIVAV